MFIALLLVQSFSFPLYAAIFSKMIRSMSTFFIVSQCLIITTFFPPDIHCQSIGYIGPSCLVTDHFLYIHGSFVRKLEPAETRAFHKYQGATEVHKQIREALIRGTVSIPSNSSLHFVPSEIPSFCNGFDDNLEIVLNGCIVRKEHVFIDGRMIRPLTQSEKLKIATIVQQRMASRKEINLEMGHRRMRRMGDQSNYLKQNPADITDKSKTNTERGIRVGPRSNLTAELLNFLGINSSVVQRFLPMARRSALLGKLNDSLVKALEKQVTTEKTNKVVEQQMEFDQLTSSAEIPKSKKIVREDDSSERSLDDTNRATREGNRAKETTSEGKQTYNGIKNRIKTGALFADTGIPHVIIPVTVDGQQQKAASHSWDWAGQSSIGADAVRPGEVVDIGGTSYVAVPLHKVLSSTTDQKFGLMTALANSPTQMPGIYHYQQHFFAKAQESNANLPLAGDYDNGNSFPAQYQQYPQSISSEHSAGPSVVTNGQNQMSERQMNNTSDLPNEICLTH